MFLCERSHMATLQPSATSWRASSRPMPVPPPVTTAIFPLKSFIRTRPSLSATRPSSRRERLPHGADHPARAIVAHRAAAHLVHRIRVGGARVEVDDDHRAAVAAPEYRVRIGG